jgi:copper(I)-binding protein
LSLKVTPLGRSIPKNNERYRSPVRKRFAATLLIAVSPELLLTGWVPFAAASSPTLSVAHVTVTAANARGNSAVAMSVTNNAAGPISLISVTSPRSRLSMIDYDTNMCQGNHAMMLIANILISGRYTQKLGYTYQGAMLRQLKVPLVKGESIPLVITWSNFQQSYTLTVKAKVVAPPKHLNFGMSTMGM